MAIDNHFNCTSTAQNNHSNLYHIKTITEYTLRTRHNNSNSQHTENCGGVTVQRNREYYVKDKAILLKRNYFRYSKCFVFKDFLFANC